MFYSLLKISTVAVLLFAGSDAFASFKELACSYSKEDARVAAGNSAVRKCGKRVTYRVSDWTAYFSPEYTGGHCRPSDITCVPELPSVRYCAYARFICR